MTEKGRTGRHEETRTPDLYRANSVSDATRAEIPTGSRVGGQLNRAKSVYSKLAHVEVQQLCRKCAISGCAGGDGASSGVLAMTNRFTVSRTGETGVTWCRLEAKKDTWKVATSVSGKTI